MICLRNHRDVIAGMDFFVVPTVRFTLLYVWFVLDHARRRVLPRPSRANSILADVIEPAGTRYRLFAEFGDREVARLLQIARERGAKSPWSSWPLMGAVSRRPSRSGCMLSASLYVFGGDVAAACTPCLLASP
jgi:hypothetical protein